MIFFQRIKEGWLLKDLQGLLRAYKDQQIIKNWFFNEYFFMGQKNLLRTNRESYLDFLKIFFVVKDQLNVDSFKKYFSKDQSNVDFLRRVFQRQQTFSSTVISNFFIFKIPDNIFNSFQFSDNFNIPFHTSRQYLS